MRLEASMLISVDWTGGVPDCLLRFTRIENSSDIKGSSTANVVGKNLSPALPWAEAGSGARSPNDKAQPSTPSMNVALTDKKSPIVHFFFDLLSVDLIISKPLFVILISLKK